MSQSQTPRQNAARTSSWWAPASCHHPLHPGPAEVRAWPSGSQAQAWAARGGQAGSTRGPGSGRRARPRGSHRPPCHHAREGGGCGGWQGSSGSWAIRRWTFLAMFKLEAGRGRKGHFSFPDLIAYEVKVNQRDIEGEWLPPAGPRWWGRSPSPRKACLSPDQSSTPGRRQMMSLGPSRLPSTCPGPLGLRSAQFSLF